MVDPNAAHAASLRRLARAFASLVAALGALGLAGWLTGWTYLGRLYPGQPTMQADTAVALIAVAFALTLLAAPQPGRTSRALAGAAGVAAAALALTSVVQPPPTAAGLILCGLSLLLHAAGVERRGWITGPAVGAIALGVANAIGLATGQPQVVDGMAVLMAPTTTLGLILLGLGIIASRPTSTLPRLVASDGRGGRLVRWGVPAGVAVPVALGLAHQAAATEELERRLGIDLVDVGTVAGLALLLALFGRWLDRADTERAQADAALAESERRTRAIVDRALDAFVSIDGDGAVTEWNPSAEKMFGWTRDEAIGRDLATTLVPAAFRDAHLAGLERFLQTGEARVLGKRLELTAMHREGHELPVELTISPIRTDAGWAFNAFIQDISERRESELELRESEERFRALATQSPGGIYETDAGGGLTFASRRWCEITGLSHEQGEGHGWLEAIHPDDLNAVTREWIEAVREDRDFEREYRVLRPDGTIRWVHGTATPVRADHGEITGFLGACLDITDRWRDEVARAEAEARFRSAFNDAPIGMAMNDLDGRFTEVNRTLVEMTGYSADELCQMSFEAITHPDDVIADREGRRALLSGRIPAFSMEKRYIHADGHPVWVGLNVAVVRAPGGQPLHTLTQVQDITERRSYEQKLQHMADHDPLTGLLNRRSFDRELQSHVDRSSRYGAEGALLVLDIDHFKYVNDTLGHNVGDELIVLVAQAVRESLRSSDVVARLGGDEFAVLLPKADAEAAARVAANLGERIRHAELPLAGRARQLSASIGVALLADAPNLTAEDLLANADLAMYDAKEAGRDRFALYSSDGHHEARMKGRVRWVERIRQALEDESFTLLAQPIVDLSTGDATRHELLLRMRDQTGDLIPPGAFLYIAERLDMVQEIDCWVAGQAIDLLAERERAGFPLALEVNLSGRSIGDGRLLESIERRLAATGIDATNLIFEVTETAAVANIADARRFAERLSELGCRFALDDFGAGFGSFYYLKHLPFDLLKIDGEFVRNCLTTNTDQLVISAVVDIARGLGKQTVAEFVRDDETMDLLRRLGVDYAQGFHLGKPVPVEEALLVGGAAASHPA